ncbi:MAG: MraY family glycosyltransferase [bacterium]
MNNLLNFAFVKYFICFLSAIILSFLSTLFFRKLAIKLNILDKPTNLKKHFKSTPYLGGLAIYLTFVIICLLFSPLNKTLIGILIGGTIIAITGLIDDIKGLSVHIRILIQFIVALILIICNIKIKFILNPYLSIPLSILWIMGITNAFNIIDIMNGLSSGIAFIACIFFFLIAFSINKVEILFPIIILAGSILGFFKFNFKNASIFMGDCGSLFLGLTLSSISLAESYTSKNNLGLLSPLLILAIPIYDTFLVMILRKLKGKSMFKGSPDHFALRLKSFGISNFKVVLILYGMSLILGICGYLVTITTFHQAAIIYSFVILGLLILGWKIGQLKIK